MLGHRQLNFEDYTDILRRRWWLILIPAVLGCVGTYLVSLALPNEYASRTLVLVEQPKVPDSYVKSVVSEDLLERLGTLQEQILSRTRLQPIIEKFGLFKNERGKVAVEELIDRFRKSISIVPIPSLVTTREGELPGFTITYTADDPRVAQLVCGEITSMFIEENLHLREQRAEGTTDFLKNELDQAKSNLDEQDAKLAEFKRKYLGALPGNEQMDMNMMNSFTTQLDAATSQLNRAQQDVNYEEALLAQQLTVWQASQPAPVAGPHEDTLERQLNDLQTQLVMLEARYTPDHPDVVKLKASIAEMKKRIEDNAAQQTKDSAAQAKDNAAQAKDNAAQAKDNAAQAKDNAAQAKDTASGLAKRKEPPEIQQLRVQIHQTKAFIQEKTREQGRLKEQLTTYQSRLSMGPVVEQQYKELTRGYETALKFYNDLLAKKSQSEMATSMERQQQGEQFRIMDPPNLPEKPSFPNRLLFAGGGWGVGFALGLGLTLLMEFRDKSLRTENDIEHFLDLPTLAMVPDMRKSKAPSKPLRKEKEAELAQTAHA